MLDLLLKIWLLAELSIGDQILIDYWSNDICISEHNYIKLVSNADFLNETIKFWPCNWLFHCENDDFIEN